MLQNLFIGIPIPETSRKKLKIQSWNGLQKYKDEDLSPTYNWHLTLAYIGRSDERQKNKIIEVINQVNWPVSFEYHIQLFGSFPSIEHSRVLWAGVTRGKETLENLAHEIRSTLKSKDIEFDLKPFIPHITLCRLKRPKNVSHLQDNAKMKSAIKSVAEKVHLYQSEGNKKPYLPIHTVNL